MTKPTSASALISWFRRLGPGQITGAADDDPSGIATGLFALPVLAGCAAYTIGELQGWRSGLEQEPQNAVPFYGTIALSIALGLSMLVLPIDPIKALLWSAFLNSVIAPPLLVATMIVASSRRHLGRFITSLGLKFVG